jgi:hypothetical protein
VRTLLPTTKAVRLLGVTVSNFDQLPINPVDELPLFDAGAPDQRVFAPSSADTVITSDP